MCCANAAKPEPINWADNRKLRDFRNTRKKILLILLNFGESFRTIFRVFRQKVANKACTGTFSNRH